MLDQSCIALCREHQQSCSLQRCQCQLGFGHFIISLIGLSYSATVHLKFEISWLHPDHAFKR